MKIILKLTSLIIKKKTATMFYSVYGDFMKKLLLAASISLSISSLNAYAETVAVENVEKDVRLTNFEQLDVNYGKKAYLMEFNEAIDIENERAASGEELYIAGLFFYGSKNYNNINKAASSFLLSARKDFEPAKYILSKLVLNRETSIITQFEALNLLKEIKNDKDYESKAAEILVDFYLENKDYDKAIIYLSKLKNKDSLYKIAKIYEYKGDKETADMIYRKAAGLGHVDSKIFMAKSYLEKDSLDTKKAISLLKEIAKTGKDPETISVAQTLLGDIYFNGNQDIYADHEEGVSWYKKAANNNYHEAMLKLHAIYLENEGSNKYRLGKNKFYIHDLGVKIRKEIYKENI